MARMETENSIESVTLSGVRFPDSVVWIYESLQLMTLLYGFFSVLIVIQLIGLLQCARILIKHDIVKDIRRFLNEYWQWSQVRKNSVLLSLWLSSTIAYLTVWLATLSVDDVPLHRVMTESPWALCYIAIGCIVLLGYTLSRTRDQISATKESVKRLKQMRMYSAFKSVLRKIQGSPVNTSSWGMWIGTAAAATEWLSERWVKRRIDAETKEAILHFSAYATVEYLFRMSLVGVAIGIIYR